MSVVLAAAPGIVKYSVFPLMLLAIQLPTPRAGQTRLPVWCSLHAVGERSLFHTLRNAPRVMGRAPANRKTISPTMRSHSSLW